MSPQVSGTTLVYFARLDEIDVYTASGSWPSPSLSPVGVIYDGATGTLCADYVAGITTKRLTDNYLFVLDSGKIDEYVGGSLLSAATLSDAGASPVDCAVDPKNGDLAVANGGGSSSSPSVAIYEREKRGVWNSTPSQIAADQTMSTFKYCGLDQAGNLYLTGTDTSNATAIRRFVPGRPRFGHVVLNQTLNGPGGVLWDGSHVAIEDSSTSPSIVYQFNIQGTNGVETGSTTLNYCCRGMVAQFWIYEGALIGPEPNIDTEVIWSYPAGGGPNEGGTQAAAGAAVVIAQ